MNNTSGVGQDGDARKHARGVLCVWLVIFSLGTSGCASLINGTTQAVPVNSEPGGAEVRVNGKVVGSTPITLRLRRKDTTTIEVSKDGYQPAFTRLESSGNIWLWIDLLCLGFPAAIDLLSGGGYDLTPTAFYANLEVQEQPTAEKPQGTQKTEKAGDMDTSSAVRILKQLKELKAAGALTDEEYRAKVDAVLRGL